MTWVTCGAMSKRAAQIIDREIGGIGRITIRTGRFSKAQVRQLDAAILHAKRDGHLDALALLKDREVAPSAFLSAATSGRLGTLRRRQPIAPLLNQWLGTKALRSSSVARYRQSWRIMLNSLPPDAALDDISERWWHDFAGTRTVKASTLNRDRAALVAFLAWAQQMGHHALTLRARKLKEEPVRSGILSDTDIKALQAHCRPDRWTFFWALLETGARQGEVLNLRVEDVEGGDPGIVIRSQEGSKRRGDERFVPCSPAMHRTLKALGRRSSDGRVFPNSRRTVQIWWKGLAKAAGLHGVTLHGLRATYITQALDAGIAPVEVQKLVGHTDLATTMRYYRNPKTSSAAAATIRAAIGIEAGVGSVGGGVAGRKAH